ncbi:MAG TPA: hypothetical protein VFS67_30195 [Polyangiaceae bacterium]|nr:hypothetical protein [Polyangiaceae bacterium]
MSSVTGTWSKVTGWVGVWLFAGSVLGVGALFRFFDSLPLPNRLDDMVPPLRIACGSTGRAPLEALSLFAAQSRWAAFALLLATVAAIAFVVAIATLIGIARDTPVAPAESDRQATIAVSVLGLAATVFHLFRLNHGDASGTGFLTTLLRTVSGSGGCEAIRAMVWPLRTVGEGTAFLLAAAMAATASRSPDPATVARRIGTLQLLLYCGSLLFVVGILVSQSNFAWVSAQWAGYPREESLAQAIDAIVQAGTLQAGVGYSALLVAFFLPARSYLAWRARCVAPRAELHDNAQERKSLEDAGLVGSWRDDVKQILALVAPILSAPLFDALAK